MDKDLSRPSEWHGDKNLRMCPKLNARMQHKAQQVLQDVSFMEQESGDTYNVQHGATDAKQHINQLLAMLKEATE